VSGDRLAGVDPDCETCDGDGYVDIVDGWGGVIGPAPCPACSDSEGYYESRDEYLPPEALARLDSGAAEGDA